MGINEKERNGNDSSLDSDINNDAITASVRKRQATQHLSAKNGCQLYDHRPRKMSVGGNSAIAWSQVQDEKGGGAPKRNHKSIKGGNSAIAWSQVQDEKGGGAPKRKPKNIEGGNSAIAWSQVQDEKGGGTSKLEQRKLKRW